jgi:hypothetical protein
MEFIMKKELFLTALMSVTAFSAQASAGLALQASKACITALLAGEVYVIGLITPDHIRYQAQETLGQIGEGVRAGLNGIVDAVADVVNTGTTEVIKSVCDQGTKSSFVRNIVITGTVAAATYYGIKAMKQKNAAVKSLAQELREIEQLKKKKQ